MLTMNANEREVTDPVTHLPLAIHNTTSGELQQISTPPAVVGSRHEASSQKDGKSMDDAIREELSSGRWDEDDENKMKIRIAMLAAAAASAGGAGSLMLFWLLRKMLRGPGGFWWADVFIAGFSCCALGVGASAGALYHRKLNTQEKPGPPSSVVEREKPPQQESPESAVWLNSLFHSLWPIVNPALFTSVSDMLEDALQASLPKLIHGVRVADIGQGSEPLRVLGIRWLDAGEAAVDKDGLKAEEGDFVNLEVAVAYRARSTNSSSGLKMRSQNAHLLMEFWVAGGMILPVWVELTGILTTARLRIQISPNPPFFSVLTLTLLGQPKIKLTCTPLAKNFLNIMDVPGLSGWLHRAIDQAVSIYVAPGSLNVDLKTILMGREKMDTDTVGVVVLIIKRARGFKDGDRAKILQSRDNRKGDCYVTSGWSKLGKPMWSSRIIQNEGYPCWEEFTTLLVGATEINAQEKLRLQLWDSDRLTSDDLLGTVDVPLQEIMSTQNEMTSRDDRLTDIDGTPWTGALQWEFGYYTKTTLEQHLSTSHKDPAEIKRKIEQEAEDKLREAKSAGNDETAEVAQQKEEDLKERTDEIIASTKPSEDWPSGVLSIRVEQITGLEVQKSRESGVKEDGEDDDAADLPSAYCTFIINHQRVYKTRTKLKSNKPFFNAGTEKFVKDWRTTTVIIAVRDNRLHEAHPLLGAVILPLPVLFKHCSQLSTFVPLVGGIGYGRIKVSLAFRSIQAKLPRQLIGWDVGTLDIQSHASASMDLPADLASCKLIFRTIYAKDSMSPHQDGGWDKKRDRPIRLAVTKRYASCLLVRFKKHALGPDLTPAFCTLWLKDVPDDEEVELKLPVYKNEHDAMARARANAAESAPGERVGTLNVTLRFWPGLSGYHQNLADGDLNMADVMEVLDCTEEAKGVTQGTLNNGDAHEASSSSSSSSSEDEDEDFGQHSSARESKKSLLDGFSEYRKKKGELHRKHRGLMQWSAARNVAWIGRGAEDKAERLGGKVKRIFKHSDREAGIEKEV